MAYARWFLRQRLETLNRCIRGEYCCGIRDRWTNRDLYWAYKLGRIHGRKEAK